MKIKQALLGVTLATAAAFVFADELPANANALQAPEIKCYGVNACKGKSDCRSAKNNCKGENACKGKGFSLYSEDDCYDLDGNTVER